MKCEGCGQTDLRYVSKDEIFTVYICTYCHRLTWIQNPTVEFTKTDLNDCFLRLSKNFDRLQQENQRTYQKQEIAANNRHFETRLDHLKSDLRNIEFHATSVHYLDEKRQALIEMYRLFENHYTDLLQILQTTTNLSEVKETAELILHNIGSQINLLNKLQAVEINVQSLRKTLATRQETMWDCLISTEYRIALKDFRILSATPDTDSPLQTWEDHKRRLISGEKLLSTYQARDEVKKRLQYNFRTNIHAAELKCHALRQKLLRKRLRTNPDSHLPNSLSELGREYDVINRDLDFLHKLMPQKEAREFYDKLTFRKVRVLCAIIFKSTILKLKSRQ